MLRIGLLLAGAYWLYTNLTRFNDALKYSFTNVRLNWNAQNPTQTSISTTMNIQNPTTTSITIQSFSGTTYINNRPVATFTGQGPFTIMPEDNTSVSVKAQVTNATLAGSLAQLIRYRSLPTMVFSGHLQTSIGRIPFNYTAVEGASQ